MIGVVRLPPLSKRGITQQAELDTQRINARRRRVGLEYQQVEGMLESMAAAQQKRMTRDWLFELANCVIEQYGKNGLDRLAKRNKVALISWFCENWHDAVSTIRPGLPQQESLLALILAPTVLNTTESIQGLAPDHPRIVACGRCPKRIFAQEFNYHSIYQT
jgi:hypothetical protein